MTPTLTSLARAPSAEPGGEYVALRNQALALVQMLAHENWTDYNHSDPGVTTVEQLCYALTEIPYRASLPVSTLLSSPNTRTVNVRAHGLLPAWSILPCKPVTSTDLRRALMDRVRCLRNVWFEQAAPSGNQQHAGLYDVYVLADRVPGDHENGDRQTVERVSRCYARLRALGEDVRAIHLLRPCETEVLAEVQIEDLVNPSDMLARALFQLGLALAPEPRRHDLTTQIAQSGSTAQVFSGPLMLRGFIADAQLAARASEISVSTLQSVLASIEGVVSVRGFAVKLGHDASLYAAGDSITVPNGSVLQLQTAPVNGHYSLRLLQNGRRCVPDARRVSRVLARLWAQHRQTFRLREEYAQAYPMPASNYQDLAAYNSVQMEFPATYGIGANGLMSGATVERQAQARQMQGFLMVFDQMMANAFAQLAHLPTLFSLKAGGQTTYATQSLRPVVPGAQELLSPHYETGLAELSGESDPVDQRRNALLDFLLSLYAQSLDLVESMDPITEGDQRREHVLIRYKQLLLAQVAPLSRDRGSGGDVRQPHSRRNASGLERIGRLQLGLLDADWPDPAPLASAGEGSPDFSVTDDPDASSFGRRLRAEHWAQVEHRFRPLDPLLNGGPAPPFSARAAHLSGHRIAAALLAGLADRGRYRIGWIEQSTTVVVVCLGSDGHWWLVGEHTDEVVAVRYIDDLVHASRQHPSNRHSPDLYIVDWVLLRFARPHSIGRREDAFRVTAVLPMQDETQHTSAWREDATAVLRNSAPAHIRLECLFLDRAGFAEFRRLDMLWRCAIATGSPADMIWPCHALAVFLDAKVREGAPMQPLRPPPPADLQRPVAPRPDPFESDVRHPVGPPPHAMPPASAADAPSHALAAPVALHGHEPAGAAQEGGSPPELNRWPGQLRAHPGAMPMPPLSAGAKPSLWRRVAGACRALLRSAKRPWAALPFSTTAPTPRSTRGRVAAAPPGAQGFDCDTVLTPETARSFFVNEGMRFTVRYLSRNFSATRDSATGDLTESEVEAILGSGLALMAVQHVEPSGWAPSASKGTAYGQSAVANAQAAGIPAGVNLWLDLEGVAAGTAASTVTAYCQAWFDAVNQAGYAPGLYVGAQCVLEGTQLGSLAFQYFWQSGSQVPTPGCGFCMVQTISDSRSLDGVAFDLDRTQADHLGRTPQWLERG